MGDGKAGRRPLTYDDRLAIERGLNRGHTRDILVYVKQAMSKRGWYRFSVPSL